MTTGRLKFGLPMPRMNLCSVPKPTRYLLHQFPMYHAAPPRHDLGHRPSRRAGPASPAPADCAAWGRCVLSNPSQRTRRRARRFGGKNISSRPVGEDQKGRNPGRLGSDQQPYIVPRQYSCPLHSPLNILALLPLRLLHPQRLERGVSGVGVEAGLEFGEQFAGDAGNVGYAGHR